MGRSSPKALRHEVLEMWLSLNGNSDPSMDKTFVRLFIAVMSVATCVSFESASAVMSVATCVSV